MNTTDTNMDYVLIGLAARARSGKDTVARHLKDRHGFSTFAFSDPIKKGAQQLFGLTDEETWDDNFKETPLPRWGLSPRRIFQLLGTEFGREMIDPDIWVKRARFSIEELVKKGCRRVCLTDIRVENEAALIRSMGGFVFHIVRPHAATVAAHKTEAGVVIHADDFLIQNTGTLEQLYRNVDALVNMVQDKTRLQT